jgi:hypothetical protein
VANTEFDAVLSSAGAALKMQTLESAGITPESLAEYFGCCLAVQAAFCEQKRESNGVLGKYGFGFSQVKNLYLTPMIATVCACLGDVEMGPYHVEVVANAEFKVDPEWMRAMSQALYENQNIPYCQMDQIGVANRQVDADFMSSFVYVTDEASHEMEIRSHSGSIDERCTFINGLMGLTLIDMNDSRLYPFEGYYHYGNPRGIVAIHPKDGKDNP